METHVRADEAVRAVVEHSGKSKAQVSRDIGRSSAFIGVTIHKQSVPSAELMARIAEACGMELQLTDGKTVIAIEATPDGDETIGGGK